MIHRCRPDPSVAFLWQGLHQALAHPGQRKRLGMVGGRPLVFVPQARDGLRWLLRRAGVGAGHEVAVPALICESVAESILACGARPLAFGVSERDFGPSAEACEAALCDATKAIVLPHLYGVPADLGAFAALAEARGCLLVEDCAPCVGGQAGDLEVGGGGHAAIYSFKYDKPLALGWGGAIALSPTMAQRFAQPESAPMSEEDDRLLAASLVAEHCLTDAARLGNAFLGMSHALECLLLDDALADELLGLAGEGQGAARLGDWASARLALSPPSRFHRLLAGAKRRLRRLAPDALRRLKPPASTRDAVAARFGGKSLRPAGACEHLLAIQQERLGEGSDSAARARLAAVYREGLDAERFVVPAPPRPPAHWLRFPVAVR
ncbi:MAG: DegT/DnrJ/EryC1/StrS family aminotransferase, partial [Candidatus Brocadiia bacterium]